MPNISDKTFVVCPDCHRSILIDFISISEVFKRRNAEFNRTPKQPGKTMVEIFLDNDAGSIVNIFDNPKDAADFVYYATHTPGITKVNAVTEATNKADFVKISMGTYLKGMFK